MGIFISCFKINRRNWIKIHKNYDLNRKNSKTLTVNDIDNCSVNNESRMITCAYQQTLDDELCLKNGLSIFLIEENVHVNKGLNKFNNWVLETAKNQLTLINQSQLEFDINNPTKQITCSIQNCRFTFDLYKENNIWHDNAVDTCIERYFATEKEQQYKCLTNILSHLNQKNTPGQFHETIMRKYKQKTVPKQLIILHTTNLQDNFWIQRNSSNKPRLSQIDTKELIPRKTHQDIECPEDVNMTVRSIVKSVNSENIVTSTEQLRSYIKTLECLENTITLFFEMTMSKPKRIPAYVLACSTLKNIEVRYDNGTVTTSFKKQMSNRCELLLRSEKSKIEVISEDTYTFIGELFNKKLLPPSVLFDFVRASLDKKSSDESVENACHVLSVAGKELEKTNNLKKTMDKLRARQTSSKWSSAIEALVSLRNNKWARPLDDAPAENQSRESTCKEK